MAVIVCTRTLVDPDLWGHLRFGLDLLDTGRLNAVDPYSFTQDLPWINHEWLSELALAASFRLGGVLGMVVLKGAVIGSALALLAIRAREASQPYRSRLLAAAILATGPIAVALRPQIWTALGLALVCHLLVNRRVYWLPLVFVAWANLHGGWIVGVGVTALYALGTTIDTRRVRPIVPTVLSLTAAIAATFVNPYGWRLWSFLLSTVRLTREVEEWQPLWRQTNPVAYEFLWAVVAIGIVGTTVLWRRERLTWSTLLPTIWLGCSSVAVSRLLPLFSIVAAFFLLPAWSSRVAANQPTAKPPNRAVLIRLAIVGGVLAFQLVLPARCLPIQGWWTPDLVAAGALQTGVSGRIVLPFNWGEFAIYQWGPRLRVSIDGRRETIYSQQTIALQNEIPAGSPEALEYLSRLRPEYVWLPHSASEATKNWLKTNGYQNDVATDMSFIARRGDLPAIAPGSPLDGCFP